MSLISDNSTTWGYYSSHRENVKKAHGTYMAVLDENLEPLYDLPPTDDYSAPHSSWSVESFKGTFFLPPGGGNNSPAVNDLLFTRLSGLVSAEGGFRNDIRYIIVEPEHSRRLVYKIEYVSAVGGAHPAVIEINALNSAGFLWGELPYISPDSWDRISDYQGENPNLWRSSLSVDIGFDGVPIYNSYSLHNEYKELTDTASGAISRSCQFIELLRGTPGETFQVIKREGVDDTITLDTSFSPLADVIAEEVQMRNIKVDVTLVFPGDEPYMVPSGTSPVESPKFVIEVG